MSVFLANPWGLLALLGIPAVLLIHLLRRKSRQLVVSTLFLIERALPSSEGGRRLRRLQNSLPLWVQLLAVCALTWLLVQPRWVDATSTQTVVVVFDDSASMSAFREQALEKAQTELLHHEAAAAETRWFFLRSDGSRLAAGSSLAEGLAGVRQKWHPSQGVHDTAEAFHLGRTLAGKSGTVAFFTDRLPAEDNVLGVHWMAVGEPLENAGFLGAAVTGDKWSALVKNFGKTRRDISWRVEGETEWKTLSLSPAAITEISGVFPEGINAVMLEMKGDRFAFDDRIPILRPQPKTLTSHATSDEKHAALFEQLYEVAQPAIRGASEESDVQFSVFSPLNPQLPDRAAIIFLTDPGAGFQQAEGLLVAENHPLMENLNWQGLRASETLRLPFRDGDVALLWKGDRPMIFLRPGEKGPRLILNFDFERSNAGRLPAFVLLVNRFLDDLRSCKQAYESKNVETRQTVSVAGAGISQAPSQPGFFQMKSADGSVVFDGAAQFADLRESDFSTATTAEGNESTIETARLKNVRGGFLDPLWVAVLAAFMLWNWVLTGTPRRGVGPAV